MDVRIVGGPPRRPVARRGVSSAAPPGATLVALFQGKPRVRWRPRSRAPERPRSLNARDYATVHRRRPIGLPAQHPPRSSPAPIRRVFGDRSRRPADSEHQGGSVAAPPPAGPRSFSGGRPRADAAGVIILLRRMVRGPSAAIRPHHFPPTRPRRPTHGLPALAPPRQVRRLSAIAARSLR